MTGGKRVSHAGSAARIRADRLRNGPTDMRPDVVEVLQCTDTGQLMVVIWRKTTIPPVPRRVKP